MEKYWVPGSIHRIALDPSNPLAYGLPDQLDVYFDKNPVFRMTPPAGVRRVAWFVSDRTLRSGWALGDRYHRGEVVVSGCTCWDLTLHARTAVRGGTHRQATLQGDRHE